MDKARRKQNGYCVDDEPHIEWGNAEGIAAPSETAKPLMPEEGYVGDDRSDANRDPSNDSRTVRAPSSSMSHTDEFSRNVPKQKNWPL